MLSAAATSHTPGDHPSGEDSRQRAPRPHVPDPDTDLGDAARKQQGKHWRRVQSVAHDHDPVLEAERDHEQERADDQRCRQLAIVAHEQHAAQHRDQNAATAGTMYGEKYDIDR